MALNQKLREARERSGKTQAQIANSLRVSREVITQYETGTTPSLARLLQLEVIFGMQSGELILASTHADLALKVARALQKRINEN